MATRKGPLWPREKGTPSEVPSRGVGDGYAPRSCPAATRKEAFVHRSTPATGGHTGGGPASCCRRSSRTVSRRGECRSSRARLGAGAGAPAAGAQAPGRGRGDGSRRLAAFHLAATRCDGGRERPGGLPRVLDEVRERLDAQRDAVLADVGSQQHVHHHPRVIRRVASTVP